MIKITKATNAIKVKTIKTTETTNKKNNINIDPGMDIFESIKREINAITDHLYDLDWHIDELNSKMKRA